jgi:DNA-binding NarL/FixJ family response regulator
VQVPRHKESCAVLAIAHGGLVEGVRGLLATAFESVVMVADENALGSCVDNLHPGLVVLDMGLTPGGGIGLISRLRAGHPGLRLIVLGGDDEPALRRAALAAGAGRFLLKRALGSELMPAVDELLAWDGGKN